jgi:hypothetical protein
MVNKAIFYIMDYVEVNKLFVIMLIEWVVQCQCTNDMVSKPAQGRNKYVSLKHCNPYINVREYRRGNKKYTDLWHSIGVV